MSIAEVSQEFSLMQFVRDFCESTDEQDTNILALMILEAMPEDKKDEIILTMLPSYINQTAIRWLRKEIEDSEIEEKRPARRDPTVKRGRDIKRWPVRSHNGEAHMLKDCSVGFLQKVAKEHFERADHESRRGQQYMAVAKAMSKKHLRVAGELSDSTLKSLLKV